MKFKRYEIRRYINYFIKTYRSQLDTETEHVPENELIKAKIQAFENAIIELFRRILRKHCELTEKDVEKIFLPVFLSCIRKRSITNTIEHLKLKDIETYSVNTVFSELHEITPADIKPFADYCRIILLEIGKYFGLSLRNLIVAIDINAIPYYGDHNPKEVMGNEKKAGTNWTFKYITCSIVVEGIRFIIESIPLTQLSLIPKKVKKLLSMAKKRGSIKLVMLDRAFNGTKYQDVINKIQEKFIMPMVDNKKIDKIVANEKAEFRQIDYIYYENRAVEYQRKVKVIISDKETDGKKHLFITNIACNDKHQLKLLVESYRKRWGIETQFREKNKYCAFTCTKSYNARNIFQQIAYLLQDAWVLINFILLNEYGRMERWLEMINTDDFFEILSAFTMKLKTQFKLLVRSFHFIDDIANKVREVIRAVYT